MKRDEFWKLIELVDHDALEESDEEGALEALTEKVATLPEKEIFDFEEQMAQLLHALDGRKYAEESGESRGSDDGFLYARCFVVAAGKEYYEKVLANPKEFPKSSDHWCESLLSVACEAWGEKTGNDPYEDWEFDASVSYETGSNRSLW